MTDKPNKTPQKPRGVELFDSRGNPLGLFDVCQWWIETYPNDVFQRAKGQHPPTPIDRVVIIREQMEEILGGRQKFICNPKKHDNRDKLKH